MTDPKTLIDLETRVGSDAIVTDSDLCRTAGEDWRGVFSGPVLAVAQPKNITQVQEIIRWASETGTSLVPQSGNSSLSGGATPTSNAGAALILSARRLKKIRNFDAKQRLVTVESGVILENLQQAVAPLEVPIDLGGRGSAQVGGLLACHAGGLNVVRYGSLRNHVRGMEVVWPNGKVWNGLKQVKKDNTGYDLKSLLIGSEGTLGVFTKITVKLIPRPEKIQTVAAYFSDKDGAIDAADLIIDNNILPRTLEFLDQMTINAVRGYTGTDIGEDVKALLLVDIDGTEESVSHEIPIIENACKESKAFGIKVAQTAKERDAIWASRRSISPALYNIAPHKINEDICVPRSKIKEMLQRVDRIKDGHPIYIANFGHIGDGNIHVNIMYSDDPGQEDLAEIIVNKVMKEVVELGGSISGEHGIGNKKSQFMELEIPSHEYEIMKRFKSYFDPKGIMNPGKMFIR